MVLMEGRGRLTGASGWRPRQRWFLTVRLVRSSALITFRTDPRSLNDREMARIETETRRQDPISESVAESPRIGDGHGDDRPEPDARDLECHGPALQGGVRAGPTKARAQFAGTGHAGRDPRIQPHRRRAQPGGDGRASAAAPGPAVLSIRARGSVPRDRRASARPAHGGVRQRHRRRPRCGDGIFTLEPAEIDGSTPSEP